MRWVYSFAGLLWAQGANAGVVINECLPNPDGADGGAEWVELLNIGTEAVDLTDWSIERAKTTWSVRYTFTAGTIIAPGEYLVLGDDGVVEADLSLDVGQTLDLGNAGSDGDGLRLVDNSGVVIDVLLYGANNNNALEIEDGSVPTELAPKPSSGKSLARIPNGTDSNDCAVDFASVSEPTLGGENLGGASNDCDASMDVVINEFLPNPVGADGGSEWVELYHVGDVSLDISGWTISGGASTFGSTGTIPEDTVIEPGEYLLIGQSEAIEGAVVAEGFTLGNGSNADGVQLADCRGAIVDTVIYGEPNSDGWVDDTGELAVSLAPKPLDGKPIARAVDGVDTDQSADDFVVGSYGTPGLSNASLPEDCGATEASVVINELLVNPAGTDDGGEWVELFHAGDAPVSIQGWAIQKASSGSSYSSVVTIEDDVTLAPGEFYVIGGQFVAEAQTQVPKLGLNNGSGGDGIRLVDCEGFTADTVVYGSNNEDEVVGDGETIATSLAPNPSDDAVLARVLDGYDTNESGVDFASGTEGTPGAPNPEREPVVCIPNTSGIVINELLPDPSGDDGGNEWIELYNTTSEDISVAGWWFAMAGKYEQIEDVDYRFPGGVIVPANGYLVLGGEGVEVADVVGAFSLGNGTGGDGLLLYDCEDQLMDVALYGDENIDGIPSESGLVRDPAGKPGNDQSLARREDGVDTDDPADWYVDFSPSPGATNVSTGGGGGEEPGCGKKSGPGGCDRNAPTGDPNGCMVVPSPFGGWELLPLLVVALRRRQS